MSGSMRRLAWSLVLACVLGTAGQARGETRIRVSYTAASSYAGIFVGKDKGIFAKHGIDLELQPTALNSTIPSAMMAGSTDIGGTTTTVLLQAVDGGIDLVAVSGTNGTFAGSTNGAVLASVASGVAGPHDLVGHKVGVPGIGAILQVLLSNWLTVNGVDYRKVGFVEVGFPQQRDALQSRLVDAVITAEPSYSRMIKAGIAKDIGRTYDALPLGTQTIVYSATREWAVAHRDAVRGFHAANSEATDYIKAHPDETKAVIAKYLKLPPDAAKDIDVPNVKADFSEQDLAVIADLMDKQEMLRGKIDAAKLILR